jgi:hypothetical protein
MSGRQPRQVQRKLGEADADGNWQLGSPAPVSATDDKTQSDAGYKRRAPTAAAGPYTASKLQAAIHHNAAKETEEAVKAKPVDQGEQPVPKAEEQAAAAETNWQLRFRSTCPWDGKHQVGVAAGLEWQGRTPDQSPRHGAWLVHGTGRKRPITFSPMGKFV